jgi:pyridoxine 4-dehydrogenase
MPEPTLSIAGRNVSRIGLGTNRLTNTAENRELLQAAVAAGLGFIDTAHAYTGGDSESTIGAALERYPEDLIVATKGGYSEGDAGTLTSELEQSLESLHTPTVTLYQLHRADTNVPLEESMRTLKEFQDAGRIEHIGLSEVTVQQIERAAAIAPIVSVQNQYNLSERRHEAVVDYATEHGIVFIPYFPLRRLGPDVTAKLEQLAPNYDATPAQIALAWLLKRSPMMLPIPGTLSKRHLDENRAALEIDLTDEDFAALG